MLSLKASHRVSMKLESFSPRSPTVIQIMKKMYRDPVPDPILGLTPILGWTLPQMEGLGPNVAETWERLLSWKIFLRPKDGTLIKWHSGTLIFLLFVISIDVNNLGRDSHFLSFLSRKSLPFPGKYSPLPA